MTDQTEFRAHHYRSADDRLDLFARDYSPPGPGRNRLPLLMMHGLTRNSADFEPLAIAERGERGARKASDAMYRLLEIYYPAALTPGGETMANLLILAPFLIGKVRIAAAVIRDKRRPREEAPEEQESRAAAHPRIVVDNGPKEAGDGVTDNWYVDGLGGEVERQ